MSVVRPHMRLQTGHGPQAQHAIIPNTLANACPQCPPHPALQRRPGPASARRPRPGLKGTVLVPFGTLSSYDTWLFGCTTITRPPLPRFVCMPQGCPARHRRPPACALLQDNIVQRRATQSQRACFNVTHTVLFYFERGARRTPRIENGPRDRAREADGRVTFDLLSIAQRPPRGAIRLQY